MNLSEALEEALDEHDGLFNADTGSLALDERRVLVQLLAGPFVDRRRHPKLWPVLARSESTIRSRLADLFLDLVIDHDQHVAFTRPLDTGELDTPQLLRRKTLTFVDSVLLLILRSRLTQSDAQGERAAVSAAELVEEMRPFERASNTDRAGFQRRVKSAIEKFKASNILQELRDGDRYEISPTLKLLFSAEEVQSLTRAFDRMACGQVEPEVLEDEQDDD